LKAKMIVSDVDSGQRHPPSRNDVHDQQNYADDEQHPSYLRCNSGNTVRAQRAGDKTENEKNEGVVQH